MGFAKSKFWIFLSLCILGFILCFNPLQAIIASVPTVTFELTNSSISENTLTTSLVVNLSASSSQEITVDYLVTGGTANNTNWGSGQDYTLTQGTLTFAPGIVTQNISLSIIDDSIQEADETIKIKLLHPQNVSIGENSLHTMRLIDNDRGAIFDVVKDFGAAGDGITDDTKAIQTAVDSVYEQGGGVIVFPPRVYIVTSVNLKENITYQGYKATIKRPDNQDKWTRTFIANYAGEANSQPLIIKGFTFDGNSKNQGDYQKYELEQAHLIFLVGDPKLPGKLQAFIEDCNFIDGVADGISVYTNVSVKVFNCEAVNVFRGGFVLTGGNSEAEVYSLTTRGETDDTGIDIEVDGEGYGGSLKVDVKLENLNLINGNFDIAVSDSSTVTGNDIISDAPFYIFSRNSTMKFTNSQFKVGATDGYMNRIVFPYNITFENCDFYVTRKETKRPYSFFSVADVWWQHPSYERQSNQLLVFRNCSFKVDSNIKKTDKTYAIYLRRDAELANNRLVLDTVDISQNFNVGIFRQK